jgi:hypothetical protein
MEALGCIDIQGAYANIHPSPRREEGGEGVRRQRLFSAGEPLTLALSPSARGGD